MFLHYEVGFLRMLMRFSRWRLAMAMAMVAVALAMPLSPALAQSRANAGEDPMIELNLPEDLEVDVLIDYVSKRLKLNIVYDEVVRSKKVTIKSPKPLPKSSLLSLLQSALQMKGLMLVDMPQENWMKVVSSEKMIQAAGVLQVGDQAGEGDVSANRVMTQIFALEYIAPDQAGNLLKPFLTTPGGNMIPVVAQSLLIVTDLEQNIVRLRRILELADQPTQKVTTAIIPIEYADAEGVARMVKQVLTGIRRFHGKARAAGDTVESYHDPRTNRLIVIGPQWAVDDTVALIKELDVPVEEARSPIQFYKLVNSTAEDVLETIRAINEGGRAIDLGGGEIALNDSYYDNQTAENENQDQQRGENGQKQGRGPEDDLGKPVAIVTNKSTASARPSLLGSHMSSVSTGRATITADTNTNTIIVVGDPAIQQVYEQLIKRLDQRRPQVLLEVTIIGLDTSNGFTMAVDVQSDSVFGSASENQVVTFSSFGVTTVDADDGTLVFSPNIGFNGALFGPDIANIAITALKRTGKVEVMSAPKLLVNDNTEGTLDSTLEEPYSEVINASSTLATTTFGGSATAGTIISVTPHISEHDYIQVEFEVELSAFRGERIENLPPPTQVNKFTSTVTIPDGYTIVVGGLKRTDLQESVSAVPILGEIPIIKHLFRSENNDESETTIFVFIRSTIVKQDNFHDRKYLSDLELKKAEMPGNYPTSEPLMVQ